MKMKVKKDWVDKCIQEMARKAIKDHKVFEYMLFWMKEPIGWQIKAKQFLQEELRFKEERRKEKGL